MLRGIIAALLLCAAPAAADDHLVYVEALGKAGPYGVGYEYRLSPWLSVGAAGSYAVISEQHLAAFAPYAHVRIAGGTRHSLFTEVGAVLAHSKIPSPVDDWQGMSEFGAGGFASLGWQFAFDRFVLRASGSLMAGEGGTGMTVGFAIGVRP